MRLKMNGEKVDTSPDNTVLFKYAGELSMYNFVYVNGVNSYVELWEQSEYKDLYTKLAKLAVDENYPKHTELQEVDPDVVNSFAEKALKDVAKLDAVPIEWQKKH